MARLFADENFSLRIVEGLRAVGHDVLTVAEIGKANKRWSDDQVFYFCVAQRRALLTRNRRHFYKLHLQFPQHFGIVACTEDPDFAGAITRINEALKENIEGRFVKIYRPHQ